MGGKSDAPAPPPVEAPPEQFDSMAMFSLFSQMMANSAPQTPLPIIPEVPDIEAPDAIDWSQRTKELAVKARADYSKEQRQKRGRTDTILSSPILDEQLSKDSLLS